MISDEVWKVTEDRGHPKPGAKARVCAESHIRGVGQFNSVTVGGGLLGINFLGGFSLVVKGCGPGRLYGRS